jgi:transposase InsO family protein
VELIRTDNDRAIINKDSLAALAKRGTVFKTSALYTPHQNGVAESSNQLVESRTHSMVIAASYIPENLWPYAFRYAVELLNHTPTEALADHSKICIAPVNF